MRQRAEQTRTFPVQIGRRLRHSPDPRAAADGEGGAAAGWEGPAAAQEPPVPPALAPHRSGGPSPARPLPPSPGGLKTIIRH